MEKKFDWQQYARDTSTAVNLIKDDNKEAWDSLGQTEKWNTVLASYLLVLHTHIAIEANLEGLGV